LAAWPAAWGVVLVIANGTRMVQQVIIRNREKENDGILLVFAMSVGLLFTIILLCLSLSPFGATVLQAFVGQDISLYQSVQPVVLICSFVPFLVAVQNAIQGFLIAEGKTGKINIATWIGSSVLLSFSAIAVSVGVSGSQAASIAMITSLSVETLFLIYEFSKNSSWFSQLRVAESLNFGLRRVK
jgi:progressive ankylosis protein